MWCHHFSYREKFGFLSDQYHLQADRQFRFYALPDFQNARLVCRVWNNWLLNDFAFWKHFCIEGQRSLEFAKHLVARFPENLFHIRIRVDHGSDHEFFDCYESDEDGVETGDEDDVAMNAEVGHGEYVMAEGTEYSSSEESTDSDHEDRRASVPKGKMVAPTWIPKVPGPWVHEAIKLVSSILPHIRAISLRLPTETIDTALFCWAKIGAPSLRQCSLEATDYDERTAKDVERWLSSAPADRKQFRPPPPTLAPFVSRAPLLSSIVFMNYYVPICPDEDMDLDFARLERFALICDRHDAPLIGPLSTDIQTHLLIPTTLKKCRDLTLDLNTELFELSLQQLRQLPSLRRVTLGHGELRVNSSSPADLLPLPQIFFAPQRHTLKSIHPHSTGPRRTELPRNNPISSRRDSCPRMPAFD